MAPPHLTDPELRDAEYAYLTTTGRVTGAPHTVELWFVADGDTVWFLSDATPDWQHNAKANPDVQVRIGAWKWTATAHLELPSEMSRPGLAARMAMVAKYEAGYHESLNNWARDALALGARVIEPPEPTDDTWTAS
jgi:deazaflavin-dependent oxidoreductase (nitroreductase family)